MIFDQLVPTAMYEVNIYAKVTPYSNLLYRMVKFNQSATLCVCIVSLTLGFSFAFFYDIYAQFVESRACIQR